MQVQQNI